MKNLNSTKGKTMADLITKQDVERALPSNLKTKVSQDLVDTLNNLSQDQNLAKTIRDNFISYTSVLKDGQFKIEDYLNAVAYVSFKMMNYNNQEAYMRTFPARYNKLVADGRTSKEISAYVAAYNKNKLVNLVLEQSIIPSWIMNQDAYQQAINTQLDIMRTSQSDMARTQAANSILNHLKKPESAAVELNINTGQSDGINQLKDTISALAQQQQMLMEQGVSTKAASQFKIIEHKEEAEDA